ncbi:MAG: enoyl-CoA hydratase-related protein [Sphingomonas sp.]
MSGPDTVLYQPHGRVAHLVLNRPDNLNALSPQVQKDLNAVLDRLEADESVRVGVLRGAGRAFCVGFDLSKGGAGFRPQRITPWGDRERLRGWTKLFERIWDCPKPIIAQVHGFCIAGGNMLPLVADITLIAEDCVVGWPKLPMGGGFVAPLFARAVGPQRAKLMEFSAGSTITGRRATEWGFAAECHPADTLADAASTLAQHIAKMPHELLHLKKASVNRVFDHAGFRETLAAATEWDTLAHEDHDVATVRGWVRDLGMKEAIAKFDREGL